MDHVAREEGSKDDPSIGTTLSGPLEQRDAPFALEVKW